MISPSQATPAGELPVPGNAVLDRVAYADLSGWTADAADEAFRVFLFSCEALTATPSTRPAKPPPSALGTICKTALALPPRTGPAAARHFFEQSFTPYRIRPASGEGFLTAYFEPEIPGSLTPAREFPVPLLARPPSLVTLGTGERPPDDLEQSLSALRRRPDAAMEAFPDRAAIEDGALEGQGLELVWLRDAVDLFMVHVQGSARVRLADGSLRRFGYAGRNGHPYTSIGKVILAEGHLALETMTLASLTGWLRANPFAARRIMRLNRSYIFFAGNERLDPSAGPIGGSGVSLTPHRSIAVDRSIWAYGLPFFLETRLPRERGTPETVARLMIAQDTGSAIVGAARADYFMGSGEAAGIRAGLVRHPMGFTVLWPDTDR